MMSPLICAEGGLIPSNSTSKIKVSPGMMDGGAPRSPYARGAGMNNCHLEPTDIICSASVQPGMTPVTGRL